MKKSNIFIILFAIVFCIIGWFSLGSQLIKGGVLYSSYVKIGDNCVERGLYQRAIKNYNLALAEKESEELYEKINASYALRYAEARELTESEYMNFLASAVKAYPANAKLVDSYTAICFEKQKYNDVYKCLTSAIKNGYSTETVKENLRKARYAFKSKQNKFITINQSAGDIFTVERFGDKWNLYSLADGLAFDSEFNYISLVSEDGFFVTTDDKDSRLVDTTGMVYGIFEGKVTDATLFADELIGVCINGVYSYCNDYGDKEFGEYEMASTFQNGLAAVKKDGKWMIVDTDGETKSEDFEEIILDYAGRYLVNDIMLAKVDGEYRIYDEDIKQVCKLDCSDVDIVTKDGIIAVAKGGKWGFVDSKGKEVIEPTYEEAKSFSNGLAAVKKDGKWGFIDTEGNLVISYQFADVGYMSDDGFCPVKYNPEEDGKPDSENDEPQSSWTIIELVLGIIKD